MSIVAGIGWHLVGAAAAASFYAPLSKVKDWSWETMWALAGIFSWIIAPWVVTAFLIPDFGAFYSQIPTQAYTGMILCGMMWGIGNVNYGLTMRYLGMSLGIGIAIGITLVVGTILPKALKGELATILSTTSGQVTLIGIIIALVGIAIVTLAGHKKEQALGTKAEEFNLKKGLVLALFCGIFSAGFAFGLSYAEPIAELAKEEGINPLYALLPSYGFIMGGGALVNLLFCFIRLYKRPELSLKQDIALPKPQLTKNAILAITGGLMWYLQFFFYSWGEASIPKEINYISWMLHMSGYVLCGGIVGLLLAEWKGVGKQPVKILIAGMLIIILAANVVGYAAHL